MKKCFFIGMIGEDGSAQRIHSDWVLNEIVRLTFAEHYKDFDVVRADDINASGAIDRQVVDALIDSDLVIADASQTNPNVMYEIGIRHSTRKPIIHMHVDGTHLPFDIGRNRSIIFNLHTAQGIKAARIQLKQFVDEALSETHTIDTPVSQAILFRQAQEQAQGTEGFILDTLDGLRNDLNSVMQYVSAKAEYVNGTSTPRSGWTTIQIRAAPGSGGFDVDLADSAMQQTPFQYRLIRSTSETATFEVEQKVKGSGLELLLRKCISSFGYEYDWIP